MISHFSFYILIKNRCKGIMIIILSLAICLHSGIFKKVLELQYSHSELEETFSIGFILRLKHKGIENC